jgi:hypothetical protein
MNNIEPGLVVVIVATLIFYLRLIVLQRKRARQANRLLQETEKNDALRKPNKVGAGAAPSSGYSILSPRSRDRMVAIIGFCAIIMGIILNRGLLPLDSLQAYWWAPTAAGIIAFSWAFQFRGH